MFSTEINVPMGTYGLIDMEINGDVDSSALESMLVCILKKSKKVDRIIWNPECPVLKDEIF